MRPCFQTADASVPTCPWRTAWSKAVERAHAIGADGAPDLRRQPDRLASPRRAAGRAARLPRAAPGAATSDPWPSTRRTSSTWPARTPDFRERSIGAARARAPSRARVRGAVRQRPHRLAPRHVRRRPAPTRLADGSRRGSSPRSTTRPTPRRLVLENSAGSGFGLGTSVAELADIAEAIAARGIADRPDRLLPRYRPRLGRGRRPRRAPDAVDAFLADFDGAIGLDRLVMVHLNDSKVGAWLACRPPRAPRRRPDRGRGPRARS